MSISSFLLYAIPALFMALVGNYIPTTELEKSHQYLAYTLCVLLTFVFKYHVDMKLKEKDKENERAAITELNEKIESLETENQKLSDDIINKEMDHANHLNSIERKLNEHLKRNYKCAENESLWTGINRVVGSVEKLANTSRESIASKKGKTNKKKSTRK